MKAKKLEEWDSIEREFFKIDEEEKTAKIVMQYDSADWTRSGLSSAWLHQNTRWI